MHLSFPCFTLVQSVKLVSICLYKFANNFNNNNNNNNGNDYTITQTTFN